MSVTEYQCANVLSACGSWNLVTVAYCYCCGTACELCPFSDNL